jgi:hypothetical protein
MAYEGDILNSCPVDLDFSNTQAIVVSGVSWNPCGHMILTCGTDSSNCWFFHVAGQGRKEWGGIYAYPKFMRGETNYQRYLKDNGKSEIRRLDAKVTNPSGAYQKLTELMISKWFWGVLPHNCAAFARDIITAGGGDVTVLLNCPDQEFVHTLSTAVEIGLIYSIGGL